LPLTWVALGTTLLYVCFAAYRLSVIGRLAAFMEAWDGSSTHLDRLQLLDYLDENQLSSTMMLVVAVGYIVTYLVWLHFLRKEVSAAGGDPVMITRHWSFVAWRIGILASVVLSVFLGNKSIEATSGADLRLSLLTEEHNQQIYG
jgi:hypothetical protein